MILILAALLAQSQSISAHQREACAPLLAVPNIDPRELRQCLNNARQAEQQAAMIRDMQGIAPAAEALKCPCTEAGVSFASDDIDQRNCRRSYFDLKRQQSVVDHGLADRATLDASTKAFATCVAEVHRRRSDEDQARHAAYEAAEEERRFNKVVSAAHDDPSVMQVVLSEKLCVARAERSETLGKIAEERRYSRRVGVVNLRDLEDLKQELMSEEEKISGIAGDMRSIKRPPVGCTDSRLKPLRECLEGADAEACSNDAMRARLTLFHSDN